MLAVVMLAGATSGAFAQHRQDERDEWLRRVDAARQDHDAFAARAAAAFRDAVEARRNASSAQTLRLDDPTLRPGDIIVTPTSLLLFKGAQSAVCEDDFERVDDLRARALPHGRALRAILRARVRR
ncbi:hypothetical protein CQW49_19425 [Methylosinus trichosporium OB3b]|uniref:Uncharacterized protein n=2 Tax=Methylocystaceae TaxID=31993 RepID=A0A2D2D4B3_METT3|nr:hypothetical protein CQW49_19425 [Methylosinus trichosporium OB3b]OBS52391.1 hypothetical protein A8B73_11040 [Methylosinus sp. 3S-1]